MKHSTILILLSFFLGACEKEEALETVPQNDITTSINGLENIHPNLLSYIITFEEEANKRGLSFADELSALETHFEDIPANNVAGQCSWSSNNPNQVSIDIPFWNNAGFSQREWVVFHELGHCVLYRNHTEEQNGQGICMSIMASGTGNCQSLYNTANRDYYLNELFATQN